MHIICAMKAKAIIVSGSDQFSVNSPLVLCIQLCVGALASMSSNHKKLWLLHLAIHRNGFMINCLQYFDMPSTTGGMFLCGMVLYFMGRCSVVWPCHACGNMVCSGMVWYIVA